MSFKELKVVCMKCNRYPILIEMHSLFGWQHVEDVWVEFVGTGLEENLLISRDECHQCIVEHMNK